MSATAIEVRNLSKRYRLGASVGFARWTGRARAAANDFWALRDVSFAVQPGEVVGLIGANGAGKSTLLKILSRITDPTSGSARIRGRVGSLLEVGTGFHPELSGRDNIYLNGAVLGMSRAEIRRKFDQIVDFAEIDRFLDTPVKRYSSGMYVRLAFAVAAHLEPEILVIDEVLAVGDAAFQAKCLGKMGEVAKVGRTILFVSHHMGPIRQLCSRAILLRKGQVAADGPSSSVVDEYLRDASAQSPAASVAQQIAALPPDPAIRFFDVAIRQDDEAANYFVTGRPTRVRVEYEVLQDTYGLRVYVLFQDADGAPIFRSFCGSDAVTLPATKAGRYVSEAMVPADLLAPISYQVAVSASIFNDRHCTPQPIRVPITVHDAGRIRNAYALAAPIPLKLAPLIPWTTQEAMACAS